MKDYSDNTFITQTSEEDLNVNNSDTWNGLNTTTLHQVSSEGTVLGMNFNSESISGTTVLDSSAENNHGTNNGATHNTTGGFNGGGCFDFDGVNDVIEVIDGEEIINGLDEISFSIWLKATSVGNDKSLIYGYIITSNSDNKLSIRYDSSGYQGGGTNVIKMGITVNTNDITLESSNNVQTTDWQHLVLTWKSGEQIKLYIDGILDVPTYNSASEVGVITGLTKFFIGSGRLSEYWNGSIDEVRIYNRSLSADEIRNLYEQRDEIHDPFVYKTV